MTSSTITMASVVDPPSPHFPRSHSSPKLSPPVGSSLDDPTFTLPAFDIPSFSDFDLGTSFFTDQKDILSRVSSTTSQNSDGSDQLRRPSLPRSRSSTTKERPKSWFPSSKRTKDESIGNKRPSTPPVDVPGSKSSGRSGLSALTELRPMERSPSVSDSFANFAKRSWISSSRSPSPKRRPISAGESPVAEDTASRLANKFSRTRKRAERSVDHPDYDRDSQSPTKPVAKPFMRATSYFSKTKPKQPSALAKLNNNTDSDNSCASSAVSLAPPASNNNDAGTSHSASCDSNSSADDLSTDMPPQVRDGLWSSFKTLEVEFKGFVLKQTGPRILQVQTVVLPFLRGTMNHPSTKNLRLEDVDRRATILNKWWAAVLEMLEGQGVKSLQPVPGVDRPILLEAATILMMRPEWQMAMTTGDAAPVQPVRPRSWTDSSESTVGSDHGAFLVQSAEHNIRTMYASNLMKQMALVVEKMSLRHAPLSLVNFAGKTCAYAFFFAPVIADILVRLWGLTPELIRRAAADLGLTGLTKVNGEDIRQRFPQALHGLSWSSSRGVWNYLKQIPELPVFVTRIPWTGPWISRWKGRDTDLFFIFCKYFHILSDKFTPSGLSLSQKAASPAFVLVQAQLLTTLDATIHRQAAMDYSLGLNAPIDGDSDAMALSLPLPPTNLMKGMAENRLIALLKHFLGDDTDDIDGARHTFAATFASMMKAATSRTSQFDHQACFTLCDFLEEALTIYHDYELSGGSTTYIDWPYWFDVWKRILGSLNTMSEIRMFCFIFTAWETLAKDPQRKEALCLNWLLKEDVFETYFNHWCPMVRAYYHRLLCWRICRDDGMSNDVDRTIFAVVATRLKTVWAHYLYLKQNAEESGRLVPSTAPMFPLPGRKFIIVRQEIDSPQPGLFMGFDSFARPSTNDGSIDLDLSDSGLGAKGEAKKRWSLLGKVLSLTASGKAAQSTSNKQHIRSTSWDEALQDMDPDMADIRPRSTSRNAPVNVSNKPAKEADADSFSSSAVFDEQKFLFKFFLGWQQPAMPSRERLLTRPRLPGPAQTRMSVRARSNTAPPPQPTGLAIATRAISGDSHTGLVDEARNARPLSPVKSGEPRISTTSKTADSSTMYKIVKEDGVEEDFGNDTMQVLEPVTNPVKPVGIYAKNGVYAGRALAEWAQVVFECDNFVERRREEGIEELSEVEVPQLSVEGFRRLSG